MDTSVIKECKALSLANKIKFPQVIQKLMTIGVERYICDLVGLQVHYYSHEGEIFTLPLDYNAEPVPPSFCPESVKNAVLDVQQNKIDYRTFLDRIISGGCSHYEVFISGKKVIYFGRDGSHQIELFPGSGK